MSYRWAGVKTNQDKLLLLILLNVIPNDNNNKM